MNLQSIMPHASADHLALLESAISEFNIVDQLDQAAFVATVAHESSGLTVFSENLNYSAAALLSMFPTHFTPEQASSYARWPEGIANHLYADRLGNGPESSADGWRYRGAGAIQLTFHDNQVACANHFGIAPDAIGDWLRTPEGACRSAAWYWIKNDLSRWAIAGDFDGVCDVVNRGHKTAADGDSNGWAARLALYQLARRVICEQ